MNVNVKRHSEVNKIRNQIRNMKAYIQNDVDTIERFLIEQRNFQRVVNTPDIVLIQNVDPNLIL